MRILRHIVAAVGSAVIATAAAATMAAQTAGATTVILVRHAEKAAQPANDPPLTEEGQARAKALWDAVKDAGVGAVITTQFARTVQTAAPTVAQLHVAPEVVNAGPATHSADVAAAIKRHAGQTVLVVGHSNTIPNIIAALGAKAPAAICDAAYDNLYVVTLAADGKATLVHGRYGVASPDDPACAGMRGP